jgi:competence protein ComEC
MTSVPHKPNFSAYPLAVIAASFAAGVLFARLASAPPAACVTLAAFASVSALVAFFKKRDARASRLVVLAFACAGAALSSVESRAARGETRLRTLYERGAIEPGEPVELTGVLERAPEFAPDGLLLSLRVESLRYKTEERRCTGRVELFAAARGTRAAAAYDALELRRGARVRLMSALARAERFRNPGVTPLGEYLELRDVDARGTLKSPLLVERLDDEAVLLPLAWLDDWRTRLVRSADALFSIDAAGVFKAAVLGNRYGLSRETAERFREGGTFHVLVISGLHITFIGGLVWWAARRFTRSRFAPWGAAVACVWTYALCVGAEASVVRASLMFTLAALAPALGRRSNPLNATGGAALALLVRRPGNLLDPSFQLTFISVLAIVAVAVPLLSNLKAIGEWRPTRATPYPPACPRPLQTLAEALYWRERVWRGETARAAYSYELFKTPWAARLERLRVQACLRFVFAAVVVSLVVQLALLPLLVVYFHRLPLASPLLNVFVGVLMVVHAFAALGALALSQLSAALAGPLVRLTEVTAALLIHGVDPFARAHVASLRLPEYSGAASAVYVLYFVPLLVLTAALMRRRPLAHPPRANDFDEGAADDFNESRVKVDEGVAARNRAAARRVLLVKLAAVASTVAVFVVVAHPFSAGRPDGRLRLDFLDVGQGDAALITMPDGATLLVDGGGRPQFRAPRRAVDESGDRGGDEGRDRDGGEGRDRDGGEGGDGGEEFERDARGVGDAVVSEYLWWRGLGRVDYVLATHADADHIAGLNDVVKNFDVEAALVGRGPVRDEEFARFAASARDASVPVYLVGRGDRLHFGAVVVEVLWPPPAGGRPDAPSGNDDSLVLRLRFGRRTFLLTGDVEASAERSLLATGDDLRCDALKVAHHGSRTSSTEGFVAATAPALAVVSVGQDSPYGHPHPEVIERWRASGAQVLTTGTRGTITVSTDGDDLKVETFIKP